MAYKRKYKKRTYRRKKMIRYRSPDQSLFGNKVYVTLRYHDFIILNPSAGLPDSHIFSANGLFDPNITGIGHQPRGFDQIMQLYINYTVLSSSITVRFAGGTLNADEIVGINLRDSDVIATSANDYIEGRHNTNQVFSVSGGRPPVLSYGMNSSSYFTIKDPLSEDNLKGDSSKNPLTENFFAIFVSPLDGTDLGTTNCSVEITYNVCFSEPETPSQS